MSRTDPASSRLYGAYLDSFGSYTFTGLLAGTYTLTPSISPPGSSTCLTFAPPSRGVTISTYAVSGQDFAASEAAACYSIRGQITYSTSGSGAGNVQVYIQNSSGQSTYRTTNSGGFYEFNYLLPDTYTITPQSCSLLLCNTFTPATRSLTVVNADIASQNFVEQF